MSIYIIRHSRYGKTRAEQEKNLRKDGFYAMADENFDKSKWLEKKGIKRSFMRQSDLEGIK